MDSLTVYHTTVKLRERDISEAVESAVAIYGDGPRAAKAPLALSYSSPEEIPQLIDSTVEAGYRTLAIELPKDPSACTLVAKAAEGHFVVSGKQLLFLAFYGKRSQLAGVEKQFTGSSEATTPLLVNRKPVEFKLGDKGAAIKTLSKEFSGVPIKLSGQVELSLGPKLIEKLVRSAFREYLMLMGTKSNKEFRKLYTDTPRSSAVAGFDCTTPQGEHVRLLVYDNEITLASEGKSAFLDSPYFSMSAFLADSPQPTIFLAGAKARYY